MPSRGIATIGAKNERGEMMDDYQEFVGRTETRTDTADARLVEGLAATLDMETPTEDLPPLWHWMLFQDWRRPGDVGPDGHPRRGGFLPPVHHLPRRMWAGGRLSFGAGIRTGDTLTRHSTIKAVSRKAGGSGELVFVTVAHVVEGPRGRVLEEEHDIVYRGAEGAAVKPGAAAAVDAREVVRVTDPDSLLLFRYSALTGNGHRIHYDMPYVTQDEGYPGLIVHGPLQATLLAAHALGAQPGRLERFSFRGLRPAFAGRPLSLHAVVEGGSVALESRDGEGATCMKAEAVIG